MSLYENHVFNKELPIIFHLDSTKTISGEGCVSNYHENIELLYCIDGKGKVVINSIPIEMTEGSLIAINSGDIHYTVSETKMTYYCMIINSDFLKKHGINVEEMYFTENITDSRGLDFFKQIILELESNERCYKALVTGEILSYMAYLCRNYTRERVSVMNDTMIKKGIIYIRLHFKEDITVDMISANAGFSRFYFSRQFKQLTGMTVTEYIQFLRCRHARELLAEGNCNVSKAAIECGFSDISYFTKVFKKQLGILPSQVSIVRNHKNNRE